jgi:hypothetical protein
VRALAGIARAKDAYSDKPVTDFRIPLREIGIDPLLYLPSVFKALYPGAYYPMYTGTGPSFFSSARPSGASWVLSGETYSRSEFV